MTGGSFVISLPEDKAIFRASIERKEYLAVIRATVEAVTGRKVEVKIQLVAPVPAETQAMASGHTPEDDRKKKLLEAATQSPVVQTFLELFPGEITDIEEA